MDGCWRHKDLHPPQENFQKQLQSLIDYVMYLVELLVISIKKNTEWIHIQCVLRKWFLIFVDFFNCGHLWEYSANTMFLWLLHYSVCRVVISYRYRILKLRFACYRTWVIVLLLCFGVFSIRIICLTFHLYLCI